MGDRGRSSSSQEAGQGWFKMKWWKKRWKSGEEQREEGGGG